MGNGRLEPRLAAVLCYMLGVVSGAIILSVERESRFVRFHALQSILYCALVGVVLVAFALAGLSVVNAVLGLPALALWVSLMYRAARGEWWQLPWVGRWAERLA